MSCQNNDTAPAKIPDQVKIEQTKASADLKVDQYKISIAKSALEKEFLLQSSFIIELPAPTSHGLKSRIVKFRQKQDRLFLMEATQGKLVSHDLPSDIIIAEYPILKEEADSIQFDFTKGMNQLFTLDDWHGHDLGEDPRQGEFSSLDLSFSYLNEAKFTDQNSLYLSQVAQVRANVFGSNTNVAVEVRYYLSPYQPNPNFSKIIAPKTFDRVGFFEVLPQYDDAGNDVIYASKFDHKKPIVFAVSSNTPKEYQQAVKDGILYWNKVFGREVLKAVMAPEGVTAPSIDQNIVQWVPWDQAGFAYADGQMDPRTGEILHAQVYLTSVFGFIGKNRARVILRNLKSKNATKSPLKLSLKGFENESLCNFDLTDRLSQNLEALLQSQVPDSVILKASQDYVREVTAHEIGHTLGLRHNFAGSLGASYNFQEREKLIRDYFDGQATPEGTIPSTSVMEYSVYEDSLLTGDLMSRGGYVGPYDRVAIGYLYDNQEALPKNAPLFCTDSHLDKFTDCLQFDLGRDIPSYAKWRSEKVLDVAVASVFEKLVEALSSPFPDRRLSLSEVELPGVDTIVKQSLDAKTGFLKSLSKKVNLLSTHRLFPIVDFTNEKEVLTAKMTLLESATEEVGGVDQFLFLSQENMEKELLSRFERKVSQNQELLGYDGEPLRLTRVIVDQMNLRAKKYFAAFVEKYMLAELSLMGREYGFADHELSWKVMAEMAEKSTHYVLADKGEKIDVAFEVKPAKEGDSVQKKNAKLRLFKYPLSTRVVAAKMLAAAHGEAFDWGAAERASLKKLLIKVAQEDLGVEPDKIAMESAPRPLRQWIFEYSKILEQL